jgi:hypothetical protein
MRSFALLVLVVLAAPASAQDECRFALSEFDKIDAAIKAAPTCAAGAKVFRACLVGASSDVARGGAIQETLRAGLPRPPAPPSAARLQLGVGRVRAQIRPQRWLDVSFGGGRMRCQCRRAVFEGKPASVSAAGPCWARADRPNGAVLLDALHLSRSGGAAAQLQDLPPGTINAAQLCDAPALQPRTEAEVIAEAGRGGYPRATSRSTRTLIPGC